MIYTLTLNPSIDYVVHVDSFVEGITNRTVGEEYYIGGKGINVSCILAELGIANTALGFTAGFTGDEIEKGLVQHGISADFIRLKEGISRINIKLKANKESEINCQGPHISEEAFEELLRKTDAIQDGDTIVLAGSIPKTVSDDAYEQILQRISGRNIRIVVDATKQLLLNCLPYHPFVIKPNRQELSEIFNLPVENEQQTKECAEKLKEMGARNVIVSLGGDGAVLFAEDGETYRTGVVKEKVLNTVGSGDSMVAGFIAGYEQSGDYGYALKLGTACGNATAFSAGLATKEKIMDILGKLG
jgi:1-phosphofructokinase